MNKITIELVKSAIGCPKWMKKIAGTLALRKLHDKVIVPDNPAMRGMARKIAHLVNVKEVQEV